MAKNAYVVRRVEWYNSLSHSPQSELNTLFLISFPSSLARDAGILVNTKGYTLKAAGIINMFPHTAHVESVAWFEKTGPCKSRKEMDEMEAAEAAAREAAKAAKKAREAEAEAKKQAELAEKAAAKEARRQHYLDNKDYYDARNAAKVVEGGEGSR